MQKLSRWSALETRRQAEEEAAAAAQESQQQLSMDQRTAAGRQLFNPKEAFVMVRYFTLARHSHVCRRTPCSAHNPSKAARKSTTISYARRGCECGCLR